MISVFEPIKQKFLSSVGNLGQLWLEKSILRAVQISVVTLTLQSVVLLLFFPRLPPQVPLFYSQSWGENRLANSQTLLILPIICLLFLVINVILSAIFLTENRFLAALLAWTATIVVVIGTIAVFAIIQLSQ
ncbi:MAG: hypothetical protein ABID04_02995 [Patescibacteria group bacterium]